MNEPTYEEIQQEELTYEQVQRVKYELWSTAVDAQFKRLRHNNGSWLKAILGSTTLLG
jgi:hypothetical protein